MCVVLVALLVGIVLSETCIRIFGGAWFQTQICLIKNRIQAFLCSVKDNEKQRLILLAGYKILLFSSTILVIIGILVIIASLGIWLLKWSKWQQTVYLIIITMVSVLWWMVRKIQLKSDILPFSKKRFNSRYGFMDRLVHWFALEPTVVRHFTFALERKFVLPKKNQIAVTKSAASAVYICGLARSGTTMLLRILNQIDIFQSLNYRDMPFVLAPNLWNKIRQHGTKQTISEERVHGDGILVNFDSPEAFEEIFWRTYTKQIPNKKYLRYSEPTPESLAAFADYRMLVTKSRSELVSTPTGQLRRYLSKNNNNLLRLRSICADTTGTVLLVYRNPLTTALSLFGQHKRFLGLQAKDHFIRSYMGWLGHYEFGLDHQPFYFAKPYMNKTLTPTKLDYWLDYWNAVYSFIIDQQDLKLYFVNYDTFCTQPKQMLNSIFSLLNIRDGNISLAQQIKPLTSRANKTNEFCPELIKRTNIIYSALLASKKNIHIKCMKI
jgi:hypothetical protein